MTPRRRRFRSPTKLLRLASGFAGILLSVIVVVGLLRANTRYFYCDAMGILFDNPCAAGIVAEDQKDAPLPASELPASELPASELRQGYVDCCKVGTLAGMPDATGLRARELPARDVIASTTVTGWATLVRADLLLPTFDRRDAGRRLERWRIPPPSPRASRAQLMVFLT